MTALVEGTRPGAAPVSARPAVHSMLHQLEEIKRSCQRFSDQHRTSIPPEIVQARLAAVLATAGEVFQDRVLQICFLLEQHGFLRFNEILRALPRTSTRTLSAKLTLLQDRGLVRRIPYDESPPRVEYELTAQGKALTDLLFPAVVHLTWQPVPEDGHGR